MGVNKNKNFHKRQFIDKIYTVRVLTKPVRDPQKLYEPIHDYILQKRMYFSNLSF